MDNSCKIVSDYHMHTPLCGHASGEPKLYAARAVQAGLQQIGFSDHAPLFSHKDPTIAMDESELVSYHNMIETVRADFKEQLDVLVAIEADYIPGFEEQTRTMLEAYPYDYVIGSVHFIEKWGFDNPIQLKEWDIRDVNAVYREYFRLVRASACSGLFNILGHVDLVKKFGFTPTIEMTGEIEENARAFKQSGVAIEINTSGLHKPAREIYPSQQHLKIYRQAGVPITFGSDAHKPDQVARDFEKGQQWALAAGYKEYVRFAKRRIATTVSLC